MNTKILTLSTLTLLMSACGGSDETKDIEETKNQQGAVAISGALEYGASLEATITDPDGISNLSNATYQWQRNAVNIADATSNSYTITKTDFNQNINIKVTYVDDNGFSNSLTSVQTTKVPAVDFPGTLTINGTAKQAQVITVELSDENGIALNQATFAWFADDDVISGETSQAITLTREQVGKKISVQVTYTDQHGFNNTLTEKQEMAVAPLENSPGVVSLIGANNESLSLKVGATVQAMITDENSVTGDITYYWYSDDVLITDNNQASYILTQADVGKSIYAKVEYVDADGYVESVLSENTEPVSDTGTGLTDAQNYPIGSHVPGNNPIHRLQAKVNMSFENGGWNAGTIFPDTHTPGRDTSLPKTFRFVQFQGMHSFFAETNITRLGNYSAKLHWKHGDPGQWNGDPTKIDNNDRKAMFHGGPASSNTTTTWYGFSVYFPIADMVLTGEQDPLIFQLHGAPDRGEPGRQPPIALTVDSNAINVGYGWDARSFNTDTRGQGRGKFSVPVNFAKDYQGRWVDFVLQISTNPFEEKGFINLWLDGKQVLKESNLQIGYNDKTGLYPSWGWYQTGDNVNRTLDAIMYMDEFRFVENTDANYYDVAPGYFAK